MYNSTAILAEVLGATDAVFAPVRDTGSPRWSTAHAARLAFEATGVAWVAGGRHPSDTAKIEATVAEMATEGLLVAIRTEGRTVGLKLTDRGDQLTRGLADLPGVAEAAETLRWATGWDEETKLAKCMRNDRHVWQRLGWLECRLAPALVRGWLEFGVNELKHIFYRVTPDGQKAMKRKAWAVVEPPEPVPQAGKILRKSFRTMTAWLDSQEPTAPGPKLLPRYPSK